MFFPAMYDLPNMRRRMLPAELKRNFHLLRLRAPGTGFDKAVNQLLLFSEDMMVNVTYLARKLEMPYAVFLTAPVWESMQTVSQECKKDMEEQVKGLLVELSHALKRRKITHPIHFSAGISGSVRKNDRLRLKALDVSGDVGRLIVMLEETGKDQGS